MFRSNVHLAVCQLYNSNEWVNRDALLLHCRPTNLSELMSSLKVRLVTCRVLLSRRPCKGMCCVTTLFYYALLLPQNVLALTTTTKVKEEVIGFAVYLLKGLLGVRYFTGLAGTCILAFVRYKNDSSSLFCATDAGTASAGCFGESHLEPYL